MRIAYGLWAKGSEEWVLVFVGAKVECNDRADELNRNGLSVSVDKVNVEDYYD